MSANFVFRISGYYPVTVIHCIVIEWKQSKNRSGHSQRYDHQSPQQHLAHAVLQSQVGTPARTVSKNWTWRKTFTDIHVTRAIVVLSDQASDYQKWNQRRTQGRSSRVLRCSLHVWTLLRASCQIKRAYINPENNNWSTLYQFANDLNDTIIKALNFGSECLSSRPEFCHGKGHHQESYRAAILGWNKWGKISLDIILFWIWFELSLFVSIDQWKF